MATSKGPSAAVPPPLALQRSFVPRPSLFIRRGRIDARELVAPTRSSPWPLDCGRSTPSSWAQRCRRCYTVRVSTIGRLLDADDVAGFYIAVAYECTRMLYLKRKDRRVNKYLVATHVALFLLVSVVCAVSPYSFASTG